MRFHFLLLPALLLPGLAAAQVGPRAAPAPQQPRPAEPLPSAVPGSRAQPGAAERTQQNLGPNEALFDAINRGDLRDARDAMSRGADLNARNVLGLTPLELSVDLGRNDISFMLLSYRGGGGGGAISSRGQETGIGGTPPRIAPSPRRSTRNVAAPAAPPSLPRLWANDGGAPQPEIGFLGFDAGRPAGARPGSRPRG